ncbi:hypothetical protein [Schumannella soli]|uniref:Uncharacterized protein n=1 Tax=Schumannella soli TaxID=2590779 RepID=A0A506YC79_9MICO|nr:hypothetical protein [Schumannella soli]TPW78039.1 hypothetical protein FJ657_05275 [Schumannella soli]
MARRNLGDLVGNLPTREPASATPVEPAEVAPEAPGEVASEAAEGKPKKATAKPAKSSPTAPDSVAYYATLIRKDTRLREDQIERLTILARRLNRAKTEGPRITENTIIRIGVDLALDQYERDQPGSTGSKRIWA